MPRVPESYHTSDPESTGSAPSNARTGQHISSLFGGNGTRVAGKSERATQRDYAQSISREMQKPKRKGGLSRGLAIGLATAFAVGVVGGYFGVRALTSDEQEYDSEPEATTISDVDTDTSTTPDATDIPDADPNFINNSEYAGELPNGVHYDFEEYADTANKPSSLSFGYDASYVYGDPEAGVSAMLNKAYKNPSILAIYASRLLVGDGEKASVGIDGMTANDVIASMGNENNPNGGALQSGMYEKLQSILTSPDTEITFGHKTGMVNTDNLPYVDNGDGKMVPREVQHGYNHSMRENSPTMYVHRHNVMINGKRTTVVFQYNLPCGIQGQDDEFTTPPGADDHTRDDQPTEGGETPVTITFEPDGTPVVIIPGPSTEGGGTPFTDTEEVTAPETPKQPDEPSTPSQPSKPEQPSQPEQPPEPEKPAKNTIAEVVNAGPRAEIVVTPGDQTNDLTEDLEKKQAEARAAEKAEADRQAAIKAAEAERKANEARAAEEAAARRAEKEAADKAAAEKAAAEKAAAEAAAKAAADKATAEKAAAEAAEAERREAERQAEAARAAEAERKANEAAQAEQARQEAARQAAETAAREQEQARARQDAATAQTATNEQTAQASGQTAAERAAGLSY